MAVDEGLHLGLFARLPFGLRRRFTARAYFGALSVALLVPTMLVSWRLANDSAAAEQAGIERNVLQKADELSSLIDHEIVSTRSILVALASSQSLKRGNFEGFYRRTLEVAQNLDLQIVLRDPRIDGQFINTSMPWGPILTKGVLAPLNESEEAAVRSGHPYVSNIFWAPLVGHYAAAVILPVPIGGAPTYYLSVGIPAQRFTEIIQHVTLPDRLSVAVFDRNGVVVARSSEPDEFVGKRVRTRPEDLAVRPARGLDDIPGLDGIKYRAGHVRSELTGWTVSVGLPESVLQARSNRMRLSFAAASVIILMTAMAGAYHLGGKFSESYGALGIDRKPSREEFRVLFEHAPNGVVVVDGRGSIALLNDQMEKMFGFPRGELIGKPVETLIPERFRSRHSALRATFETDTAPRPMGAGRELFGRRKDGSEFPIEIGLNPIRIPAGHLVMATVVDITKRKRTAGALSSAMAERDDLRRRLMQAQEEERLRLAHELHDQTGQSLTAVMLELKNIETMSTECDRGRLRLLRLQMEQMGKALHHVAWELRPASLDELGLASALANYASEWSEQYRIEIDFHCADPKLDELSDEIRTTIYRVVQEGLTNIAKHAPTATSVSVVIDRSGATVVLTIEDNGPGFDSVQKASAVERTGLGLAGMRERLTLVGGEFELESAIGAGTTVFVRIPLPLAKTAA
jgi:two-component system, NarL family, sensor histidine kinase UhpB